MNLREYLKMCEGAIVIVDDDFDPPNFSEIDNDDRTALFNLLDDDRHACQALSGILKVSADSTASELVNAAEENARALWEFFVAGTPDPAIAPCLSTLFKSAKADYDRRRGKLDMLASFCETQLGSSPRLHASLESASNDLRNCLIAFIDYQFGSPVPGQYDDDTATTFHLPYAELYTKHTHVNGETLPKIVFLISWNLPQRTILHDFRVRTGLRSAFFSGIRKIDLTQERLHAEFNRLQNQYSVLSRLDTYLSSVEAAVTRTSQRLVQDIMRLELHDLAMLNAFKLSAERESLQSYLTWLLSEALASKLRGDPALQPVVLPEPGLPLLDGKLMPESVLFELFSEIAISTVSARDHRPSFGDVYAVHELTSAASAQSDSETSLLLVISPACDLIRCSDDYDVLCVRGAITKSYTELVSLLSQKRLFGKDSSSIRHVLRCNSDVSSATTYHYITWAVGAMCTVPAANFADSHRYSRMARVSEVFCQEVKEAAVSHVSRVGVPVDPSFSVAGRVIVRYRFKSERGEALEWDTELGADYVSAVISIGRYGESRSPDMIVAFTRQFFDWIRSTLLENLREPCLRSAKLQAINQYLSNWDAAPVSFKDGKAKPECNGALHFKIESGSSVSSECRNGAMEVIILTD